MTRSSENYDKLLAHVEKYIGPIKGVFQELVSDEIAIDIIVTSPTPKRNYYTLVSYGMSELPMTVPKGAEEFRYAELMICLPATWKISDEDFKDTRNYWPFESLKKFARFPHQYGTWLYHGHTLANGNPAIPYSEEAKFQGMLLSIPNVDEVKEFFNLKISDEKTIHFFSLIPIYKEEMNYKLKYSTEELIDKLNKVETTDIVNIKRKNSCKKILGIF